MHLNTIKGQKSLWDANSSIRSSILYFWAKVYNYSYRIFRYWGLLLTGPLILKQKKILPKGFEGYLSMAKNSIS